jgi:hypothetical protein
MVRQSCLGTFRRVAVTFGEAQRGSRGKLWCAEVWRVLAGLVGAVMACGGKFSQGGAGRVGLRHGTVRQSGFGTSR